MDVLWFTNKTRKRIKINKNYQLIKQKKPILFIIINTNKKENEAFKKNYFHTQFISIFYENKRQETKNEFNPSKIMFLNEFT